MPSKTFKDYIEIIKADLFRYHGAVGIKAFSKIYFRKPGFRYVFWMRTTNYLYKRKFFKIPYYLSLWLFHRTSIKYGINIPHTTQIGPGFYIGHFGGIVVNGDVIIGKNFSLGHGVTIGQKNRGKYKGSPTIGDSVFVGAGACIIGSVTIGSNVVVGAGAVVVKDVYDNEVVVGNPARVVSTKGADSYVTWIPDCK